MRKIHGIRRRGALQARIKSGIVKQAIQEERFQRIKRSALGRRIRDLDSFDSTCFRICAYHFSDFAYFRFPEVYRGIQASEICDFLGRVVQQPRCGLSIITPIAKEETV